MKQANSSKSIIKFVIFLVACAAFIGLGFATGIFSSFGNVFQGIKLNWSSLVKLLVMIALVLAIEHLVLFTKKYIQYHSNVDYFIYGHRHIEVDLQLTKKARMIILGDWITQFSYVVYDGEHLLLSQYIEGESKP